MLKARRTEQILFFLFVLYLAVSLFTHEPWRDEAQSFLILRDLSFSDMFRQLRVEGHPIVWYALLFPFVKLGCPIVIQNIFSSVLASISVYLILFKSELELRYKILFLISPPILFRCSVIGRSYAVALLCIVIILVIFKERYGRHYKLYAAVLAILVNTQLLSAIIAGAFILSDWILLAIKREWSKIRLKEYITVFVVFILSAVLLFLTVFPKGFYSTYLSFTDPWSLWDSFASIFYSTFSGAYIIVASITHTIGNPVNTAMMAVPAICLTAFIFSLFWYAKKTKTADGYYPGVFFCVFYLALLTAIFFIKRFGPQHSSLFFLALVSVVWLMAVNAKRIQKHMDRYYIAFTILFLVFSWFEFLPPTADITVPYSDSKSVANYIIENGFDAEDTLLITPDAEDCSAVLPYLKKIRQDKSYDGFMSFVDWRYWHDLSEISISEFDIGALIGSDYDRYSHILLVAEEDHFENGEILPYKEIYSSENKALKENYNVYLIK